MSTVPDTRGERGDRDLWVGLDDDRMERLLSQDAIKRALEKGMHPAQAMELYGVPTRKHYGPEEHPGTGTSQDVHGDPGKGKTRTVDVEKVVNDLHKAARKLDKKITKVMEDAADETEGVLKGLQWRVKTNLDRAKQKLQEKLVEMADIPVADPHKLLSDMLRYTVTWREKAYAVSRKDFLELMKKAGFEVYDHKAKNYWLGKIYRGENYVFQDPSGLLFEVQFHTPKSYEAKMANTKAYTEYRNGVSSPKRRKALIEAMRDRISKAPAPPGALAMGILQPVEE